MACSKPIKIVRRGVVGGSNQIYVDMATRLVACGQCIWCRLRKSNDWATRILHEVKFHNSWECGFVTLTYAAEHYPEDGSVHLRVLQLFIKRLRKQFPNARIKFFGCGEYGDRYGRPHYHVVLMGVPWSLDWGNPSNRSGSGELLYRCDEIEKAWPYGLAEIGKVTRKSAAYVARYTIKKCTGSVADERYYVPRRDPETGMPLMDPSTGEIFMHRVEPVFATMSKKPGLGSRWISEFKGDVYPSGFLVEDGVRLSVPDYYRRKLSSDERFFDWMRRFERHRAQLASGELSPERMIVKTELVRQRLKRLRRVDF